MERHAVNRSGWLRRGMCCLAAAVTGLLLNRGVAAGLDVRWVFLASIGVFGLAHGACDLWLPGWVIGQRLTGKYVAPFCLAYLGLAGAVLLFWRWHPAAALAGFLLLTVWHWGSADAMLTGARSWRFDLLAWGRGLLVIAAPGAFHPHATLQVLVALDSGTFAPWPADRLQSVAAAVTILGLALQLLVWPRVQEGQELLRHHLETLFLLVLFAACAPLVATTLYFVWFHAWRHVLRLCRWQSPATTSLAVQVGRFHWAALPCILGALGLLWIVARMWPHDLLRAYLILLSAVTLPHALLVLWLDRLESRQTGPTAAEIPPSTNAVRCVHLAR